MYGKIIRDCPNVNCKTPIYTGECRKDCWEIYNKEMGKKPMTNADYIRSMTDEELVELIECPYGMQRPVGHGTCGDCILDWLKQPKEKEDGNKQ